MPRQVAGAFVFVRTNKLSFLFLVVAVVLTAVLYSRGLSGDFVFDDYPNIVINDNLRSVSTWEDVSRVFFSGNAGPGGRPFPVLTFAAQIAWTGLDPFYFKLVNVGIHIANGLVLFFLLNSLLTAWKERRANLFCLDARLFATLISAWWLLSPVALTSVLYVVQRMNSMSALFSLMGLWAYVVFRRRALQFPKQNFIAIFFLGLCTALSFYSKETGLLTLLYAWFIELLVFKGEANHIHWRRMFHAVMLAPVAGIALAFLMLPVWEQMLSFAGRPFTLLERLLTEARVLWLYAAQVFYPNASFFSLYHDDIVISKSLFEPPTTLFSIIGHAVFLIAGLLSIKRMPIVTFGIGWFYLGHSLESSIFPLELVFEHRNYLPSIGLMVAAIGFFSCLSNGRVNQKAFVSLTLGWILLISIVTALRADAWGDPLYPLQEAERKQNSSRANYDAGIALLHAVDDEAVWSDDLYQRGKRYFELSNSQDSQGIAALVGLLELNVRAGKDTDDSVIRDMEYRLTNGIPHVNLIFSLVSIHKLMSRDSPLFTDATTERLYSALLSNPKVRGMIRSHGLLALGLLKTKHGEAMDGLELMHNAVLETPHINEFRVIYTAALIDQRAYEEARKQLENLRARDKYGVFAKQIDNLARQISNN